MCALARHERVGWDGRTSTARMCTHARTRTCTRTHTNTCIHTHTRLGRLKYGGETMAKARSVVDAAQGGMILASQETFHQVSSALVAWPLLIHARLPLLRLIHQDVLGRKAGGALDARIELRVLNSKGVGGALWHGWSMAGWSVACTTPHHHPLWLAEWWLVAWVLVLHPSSPACRCLPCPPQLLASPLLVASMGNYELKDRTAVLQLYGLLAPCLSFRCVRGLVRGPCRWRGQPACVLQPPPACLLAPTTTHHTGLTCPWRACFHHSLPRPRHTPHAGLPTLGPSARCARAPRGGWPPPLAQQPCAS